MTDSPPPPPTNTGQQVANEDERKAMAREVAIAQGIIDPKTGAVLGRFVKTGDDE